MAEFDLDDPKVKALLRNLHSFARGLFNQMFSADPNSAGRSASDYVDDAIADFLAGETGFDPSKSPLNYHLKYHVIKQNMRDDLPGHVKSGYRAERKRAKSEHAEMAHIIGETEPLIEPDDLGAVEVELGNLLNENVLKEIEAEINTDAVVEQIYLAVVHDAYKLRERSRICEDWDIPLNEFDNGRRRFTTIVNRVLKKYKITKH
jgi:hypothetical protein